MSCSSREPACVGVMSSTSWESAACRNGRSLSSILRLFADTTSLFFLVNPRGRSMLICQSRYEPSCDRHHKYPRGEGIFNVLTLMMSARSARSGLVPVVEARHAKTSHIASSKHSPSHMPFIMYKSVLGRQERVWMITGTTIYQFKMFGRKSKI